jgi:NarL family two-component system response regulator YdfI
VIRLLIAAPSAVVRAGLESLVVSSLAAEMVGSYPDLSAVESLRPDVVLSALPVDDISPAADGHGPAYVVLADSPQPVWTRDAVRSGVRAVLPSSASAAEIVAAIEAAANGLAVVDPRDLEGLLAAGAPQLASHEAPVLTARELEVFRMMAEGAANKTIAWKLSISEHTVKFHVAAILSKLGASSRTEAVTIGVRKGMIFL